VGVGLGASGSRARKTGSAVKEAIPQVDLFTAPAAPEKIMVENPVHRAVYDALMGIDANALTPLEALVKIAEIQRRGQSRQG
jgi:hypothetical protein